MESRAADPQFRKLDEGKILETARALAKRIGERFPDSGLRRLAAEVVSVGEEVGQVSRWLAGPVWPIRALSILTILAIVTLAIAILVAADRRITPYQTLSDLLQGLDAGVNELVLLGAGLWFLVSWEQRFKRSRALVSLHALRSLAHIVDMHQLTKDPERVLKAGPGPAAAVAAAMTPAQLTWYLDYCSELLAMLSKLAALLVQDFDDPGTLAAVNEVENLCVGLSRKIWQKIGLVDARSSGG
jgi:hypothetical protein